MELCNLGRPGAAWEPGNWVPKKQARQREPHVPPPATLPNRALNNFTSITPASSQTSRRLKIAGVQSNNILGRIFTLAQT